jgi:hypothetical protein
MACAAGTFGKNCGSIASSRVGFFPQTDQQGFGRSFSSFPTLNLSRIPYPGNAAVPSVWHDDCRSRKAGDNNRTKGGMNEAE